MDSYNILVINNFQDEEISKEIDWLIKDIPNALKINESRGGLSIARNTGVENCSTEWVGYIDDDSRVPPEYITKALEIIKSGKYDCFGGHIETWWHYDRPRWLDEKYGTKPQLSTNEIILKEGFNWGGNIFFRRNSLVGVGGFDEAVGMKKHHIGYSAENRVQIILRKRNYKVGYVPSLVNEHLVAKHKLKLLWHVKAAFAEGRDAKPVFPNQYSNRALLKDFIRIPKEFAVSFYLWIYKPEYYWENFFLDFAKNISRWIGKVWALIKI